MVVIQMSLSNDLIKHQIFLQRLVGTETKNIKDMLKSLAQTAKLEALTNADTKVIKQSLRTAIDSLSKVGIQNMVDLAEYEAKFSAKVFKKHLKTTIITPDKDKLSKALASRNMEINNLTRSGTRKSVTTAYKQFARKKADELTQIIRDGQAQGLSHAEISKLIDERVNGLHTSQARTLAKTNVNYASNLARNVVVEENKQVLDKVIWVSVLDSGTTDYCQDHDGTIYNADEGPRPPAHWGCRSHVEPYVP